MADDEVMLLMWIEFLLDERGFTLTEDETDWMPPFTPDASALDARPMPLT
jgi:hypothetical protein